MAANNGGDKGTRNLVIVMVSFIVVVGVVFSLISNRSNSTAAVPASVSAADGYGIVLNPNAKPTIDVYVDYQCPACRAFEILNGGYLNEVIAQNKAKVVFHPMTFIGPESILAANAAACAADASARERKNSASAYSRSKNSSRARRATLVAAQLDAERESKEREGEQLRLRRAAPRPGRHLDHAADQIRILRSASPRLCAFGGNMR